MLPWLCTYLYWLFDDRSFILFLYFPFCLVIFRRNLVSLHFQTCTSPLPIPIGLGKDHQYSTITTIDLIVVMDVTIQEIKAIKEHMIYRVSLSMWELHPLAITSITVMNNKDYNVFLIIISRLSSIYTKKEVCPNNFYTGRKYWDGRNMIVHASDTPLPYQCHR